MTINSNCTMISFKQAIKVLVDQCESTLGPNFYLANDESQRFLNRQLCQKLRRQFMQSVLLAFRCDFFQRYWHKQTIYKWLGRLISNFPWRAFQMLISTVLGDWLAKQPLSQESSFARSPAPTNSPKTSNSFGHLFLWHQHKVLKLSYSHEYLIIKQFFVSLYRLSVLKYYNNQEKLPL